MPGFDNASARGRRSSATAAWASLITAAVPRLRSPEEANLRAPDAVVSLHVSFINAGAELIETNTFGANRRKLAHHFLEDELERINSTAVKLARDAREISGRDVFIAGAIGPLGEAADARGCGTSSSPSRRAVLEGRGADLFMLETFYDLEELVDAIAARAQRVEPADRRAAHLRRGRRDARGRDGRARRRERLAELDVAAIGANHGAGLLAALAALEQMRRDGRALAALPNIGLASLAGGRVIYPHATPDYFAEFAAHARDLGARVIGGCCGTTPAEIAAIRAAIDEERRPRAPLERRPSASSSSSLGEEQRETRARARAARGRVRRLGPARPAARRLEPRAARGRARARGRRAASASSTSTTTRPRAPG